MGAAVYSQNALNSSCSLLSVCILTVSTLATRIFREYQARESEHYAWRSRSSISDSRRYRDEKPSNTAICRSGRNKSHWQGVGRMARRNWARIPVLSNCRSRRQERCHNYLRREGDSPRERKAYRTQKRETFTWSCVRSWTTILLQRRISIMRGIYFWKWGHMLVKPQVHTRRDCVRKPRNANLEPHLTRESCST